MDYVERVRPVFDPTVRELCARRYPGHPRGCPNYGKRPSCPPAAPLIWDVLKPSRFTWVVWNDFDLAAHVERIRTRHPEWSRRQLVCCLYWQQGARNALATKINLFRRSHPNHGKLVVLTCPEAHGVNVTATMKRVGVDLEWPPVRIVRQVALVGYGAELKL